MHTSRTKALLARRISRQASAIVLALSGVGCGSANVISSSDETANDSSRPLKVATYAGSTNVSDVGGFDVSFESRTAAAVLGDSAFLAYRAGDPRFTSYVASAGNHEDQRVCAGASELGYSAGSAANGAFTRFRVPPPRGTKLLRGPVAIARFRDRLIASALASPNDRFEAARNDGECIRTSAVPGSTLPSTLESSGALAGACLVELPEGRSSCVRRGNDVFEGGSLAVTSRFVYAAYRDVTLGSVALYRAQSDGVFEEIPVPAVAVDSEVSIVSSASRLFLLYGTGGSLFLLRYDEASARWDTPSVVTTDFNRRHVPSRRSRSSLGVVGYTTALLEGDPPTLAVFWQRQVGRSARTTLRGVLCDAAFGGECRWPKHLAFSNGRDTFLPSLASVSRRAADGSIEHHHVLSYWREAWRRPTIRLHAVEFDEQKVTPLPITTGEQHPCAFLNGAKMPDWGAADASFVLGQGGEHPVAYRAFTDSTQDECDARDFRASPQHVSIIPILR